MKNSKVLFLDLVNRIKINEDSDEIKSVVFIVMEHLFSVSRTDILLEKGIDVGVIEEEKISEIVHRINTNEPVQYILGETIFYGKTFLVNPSVLIPRPETEELVRLILTHLKQHGDHDTIRLLDIGTGSGCIPITLALEIPFAEISATDVSDLALEVAHKNALRLNASVRFFKNDILNDILPVVNLDVVVSNPPYIPWEEKVNMKNNVVEFEPHIALFVPDKDPLIFYKKIAEKAFTILKPGGLLVMEINERFGKDIADLMHRVGYKGVEVVRDLFGKERIVKGTMP